MLIGNSRLSQKILNPHPQLYDAYSSGSSTVHDLGVLLQEAQAPKPKPSAAVFGARTVQSTAESIEIAFVDRGYTDNKPQKATGDRGTQLEIINMQGARRGFVLHPGRRGLERSLAWITHLRQLARDYERLADTLAALHFRVFAILILAKAAPLLTTA